MVKKKNVKTKKKMGTIKTSRKGTSRLTTDQKMYKPRGVTDLVKPLTKKTTRTK